MENVKNLLDRFGTDHLETEENASKLRESYFVFLSQSWIQRGKGISHDALMALLILILCPLMLFGGIPIVAFTQRGIVGELTMFSFCVISIYVLLIFGILRFILNLTNINKRTRANSFRKYPLVRQAAYRFIDHSKNEVIRDYIPILKIEGRTLFYIAYFQKGDAKRIPIGVLLLDDQGQVVYEDELFKKAVLTAFISITCGHLIQQKAEVVRRSMKRVVDRQIPDDIKILKNQEEQFKRSGISTQWMSMMENSSILPQALKESITILDGEESFRKAMGYEFALEFYYEDAVKLREEYLAYVRYMNAAYRRKIISVTTEGATLIQKIGALSEWNGRQKTIKALAELSAVGPDGVLSRIWQKEYEGTLDKGELESYHAKTLQAQSMGCKVVYK
jgi:hypothetical protein